MTQERCETCRFMRMRDLGGNYYIQLTETCCIRAPVNGWPVVKPHDWCGEFQEQPRA